MSDYTIDAYVSCDFDFTKCCPSSPVLVEISVTDEERGERRRFKESITPDSKTDGAWGTFVEQVAEPVYDALPLILGEEWFDQSKWLLFHGSQRSQQSPLEVPWCDEPATICCRAYQGGEEDGTLFIMARGKLLLDDELSAALGEIEPCEWFLPDYNPSDWLAHEGRFSDPYSFTENEREWTKARILRGLDVAATELAHYKKMAAIYESKTGISLSSPHLDQSLSDPPAPASPSAGFGAGGWDNIHNIPNDQLVRRYADLKGRLEALDDEPDERISKRDGIEETLDLVCAEICRRRIFPIDGYTWGDPSHPDYPHEVDDVPF